MSNQSATILIVDDEAEIREVLAETLARKTGYIVLEAPSGPEALDVYKKHGGRIDLLLTDLIMPGMTGRQLADALGAECPGMEVIFMSGYVDNSRTEAMEKRLHYFQKPLELHKIVTMISGLLKKQKKHEV